MTESDIAWWASFWGRIETWAFLGVVLTLAIEFAALRLGTPYKEKLEAAKDLKIAELNNETAKLREKLAPRRIKDEAAFLAALKGKPKPLHVDILYVDEPDSARLAEKVFSLLMQAEWFPERAPRPISSSDAKYPGTFDLVQSTVAVGGQPTGVSVLANKIDWSDKQLPATVLSDAIQAALGSSALGTHDSLAPGVIRIVVAPKP